MAITIVTQPATYHCAYNPITFELNSTNVNQPSFRYIIEIIDPNTGDPICGEIPIAPDPFTGLGVADISRIIQNKVSKFWTTSDNAQDALNTAFEYIVELGESYVEFVLFDDYGTTTSGNVGLQVDFTTTIPYLVGDQIYVQLPQIYGDCRDTLPGYYTVLDITLGTGPLDPSIIEINLENNCLLSTVGFITYADRRVSKFLGLTSSNNIVAINASQDLNEWSNTTGSLNGYLVDGASTTQKLLTNIPDGFKVTPNQHLWLNWLEGFPQSATNIFFVNSNGEFFTKDITLANFFVNKDSIGPGNLGTLTPLTPATLPLIKPNTEWYEIWISTGFIQISEKKRFIIDRRCGINDIDIIFIDRKGSAMSFNFNRRQFESINIEKEMYGNYIPNYVAQSEAVTTFHSEYTKTYTLTTNYLTDAMNLYFEELLTSGWTWIRIDNNIYSCKVMPSRFDTERKRNKKLIKRTIDVVLDLNTPINV
jgi:hypothetical protein